MDKNKVMRKPDPARRKNIHVVTLKKIETYLKDQMEPVFKSEMVRHLGVNYDSLNVALEILPIKTDDKGRIQLKKRRAKNV